MEVFLHPEDHRDAEMIPVVEKLLKRALADEIVLLIEGNFFVHDEPLTESWSIKSRSVKYRSIDWTGCCANVNGLESFECAGVEFDWASTVLYSIAGGTPGHAMISDTENGAMIMGNTLTLLARFDLDRYCDSDVLDFVGGLRIQPTISNDSSSDPRVSRT
jgi:hypothetical protein